MELAELLCELRPWADMVRYGRCGGEAMAIAVRIARADSNRDRVAFCGYHGWHDWYLSANLAEDLALDGHLLPGLEPAGVPRALVGTALPFRYNYAEELEAIVAQYGNEIGVVVMETIRNLDPVPGFLAQVRAICDRIGPAAALATIRKHRRENVAQHLVRIGQMVRDGWRVAAERAGLPITIGGLVPMNSFAIQHEEAQAASTLFTQLMLEKGFLVTKAFNTTFAHHDHIIEEYLRAAKDAFGVIAQALERGTVHEMLEDPIQHPGLARLN